MLDDCELPNPSTTSASDELRTIRATPLKPKLMLQKKVTKSVKKQRDLLEECFAKFNNQGMDLQNIINFIAFLTHDFRSSD